MPVTVSEPKALTNLALGLNQVNFKHESGKFSKYFSYFLYVICHLVHLELRYHQTVHKGVSYHGAGNHHLRICFVPLPTKTNS